MTPLLYQTLTSVHIGEGASVGNISLPLARERHTGWPWFPGSSLKGALRARARFLKPLGEDTQKAINKVFGPESEEEPGIGSLWITGACLLALPIRSIKGSFLLLSCPLALSRFRRAFPEMPVVPGPAAGEVLLPPGTNAVLTETQGVNIRENPADILGRVVLEEVAFPARRSPELEAVIKWADTYFGPVAPFAQLAVVSDDLFNRALELWTEVRTHAQIDADGVVKEGHLYTIESLPPETLLWGEIHQEDTALLPDSKEGWVAGGHKSSGQGRITWHRRTS